MSIQWFPGHMHKARKQIVETMKKVDVTIEVVDARLPYSSSNPLVQELRQRKPSLKILNKSDLADPQASQAWSRYYREQLGHEPLLLGQNKNNLRKLILDRCVAMAPHRGSADKPMRAMIIGIPNAGKSTLINALLGRRIARVADEPAVTKQQQLIELENGMWLVDTPGILWPKIEHPSSGYRLAASGAVGRNAMQEEAVAYHLLDYLRERYPEALKQRYRLSALEGNAAELLLQVGRKRGFLRPGGVVDELKAAEQLLYDFRHGDLGRITLEWPQDIPAPGTVEPDLYGPSLDDHDEETERESADIAHDAPHPK